MCLKTSESIVTRPHSGIGWKVFYLLFKTSFESPLFPDRPFEENLWYEDKKQEDLYTEASYQKYPCGFHIFTTYADALLFRDSTNVVLVIRKVEYRRLVAAGTQWASYGKSPVPRLVAREMKILPPGGRSCALAQSTYPQGFRPPARGTRSSPTTAMKRFSTE